MAIGVDVVNIERARGQSSGSPGIGGKCRQKEKKSKVKKRNVPENTEFCYTIHSIPRVTSNALYCTSRRKGGRDDPLKNQVSCAKRLDHHVRIMMFRPPWPGLSERQAELQQQPRVAPWRAWEM